MTISQWLLFFLLVQIIHFLGTWKLYDKAGFRSWQALVPIYNAFILMKIIKRSIDRNNIMNPGKIFDLN